MKSRAKKQNASSKNIFLLVVVIIIAVMIIIGVNYQKTSNSNSILKSQALQSGTKECKRIGEPVINIDQKIVNDVDEGIAGSYWAYDAYDQHIQVWKQGDNTYCAELSMDGQYDAQPGKTSPGNKQSLLTGREDGSLHADNRIIIHGNLKSEPEWPTTGVVDTQDYQCDLSGNCPGEENNQWYTKYFENIQQGDPTTERFEWTYRNGDTVWINSSESNSGDIVI